MSYKYKPNGKGNHGWKVKKGLRNKSGKLRI